MGDIKYINLSFISTRSMHNTMGGSREEALALQCSLIDRVYFPQHYWLREKAGPSLEAEEAEALCGITHRRAYMSVTVEVCMKTPGAQSRAHLRSWVWGRGGRLGQGTAPCEGSLIANIRNQF